MIVILLMLNFMHTELLGYRKNQHDRQSRLVTSDTKTTINAISVTLLELLGFLLEHVATSEASHNSARGKYSCAA